MTVTAVDGVTAAGHLPTWIIQKATIVTEPVKDGVYSIPLTALTAPTTEKIDCHYDMGDISINRAMRTRERQRACQLIAETIKVGETIDITISAVYDQQAAATEDINAAYTALPEGSQVYVFRAYGWPSADAPTTATKGDLYRATVNMVSKTEPANADEDLKFQAVLSADAFWPDITLTAGA